MDLHSGGSQLLTTKRGSESNPNHGWWKPDHVQGGHIHTHSGPHNVKTAMEQHPKHRWGLMHAFGPEKIPSVSDGGLRLL